MATQAQIEDLAALYAGYFDRAPDPAGLQFWIDEIDGGREFNTIAEDFAASPEAEALYPYLTTPGVSSPALFVTEIYANLFGRAPDEAGLEFWTGVLDAGTVSVADFIEAIIVGAVDAPDATPPTFDQTTLDNKVEVGLDFADATGNTPGFTYDEQAAAAAVGVLDGVTEDPATVDAAKAETAAFVETGVIPGGGLEGTTFTLTSDADNLTGTASDDTFQGIVDAAADTSTLTTFDVLNGGAGLDTFNLLLEDTAAAPTFLVDLPGSFTLSGIEIVNLVSADGTVLDNGSADLSAFTGAQQVWQIDDYNSDTFVGAGQAAGFRGLDGGSVDVTYEDGADAAVVALDGLTDDFSVYVYDEDDPSLTSLTVAGTADDDGDENSEDLYIDAEAEDITTVNIAISSDSSIEIEASNDEQLTTIDASGSTGDLFLVTDYNYALENVMGGSGNDYIEVETYYQTEIDVSAGAGNDFLYLYWDEDELNFTSTISGGSGSDTFFFEYLEQIDDASADVADYMAEITDFSASEDVLDISDLDFGQLSNTALANIAGEATLKDAIETAADEIYNLGFAGEFETAVFDYAGDMYVFNDYENDGELGDGDGVVKVTGMSTDELDSSNFITMA